MKQTASKDDSPLIPVRARAASVWAFLKLVKQQFVEDGCPSSAAALTYTTLFAIVPMMTVMFAVIAAIPALNERGLVIQEWAFDYFVPSAGNQILEYLSRFANQATNLTGVGVLFLVVTSLLMLRTIEQALNRIWKVSQPPFGVANVMMYWAVLSLGPLLLGAGLGISSYLTSLSLVSDTVDFLGGLRLWLSVLPLVLTTAMLALLYIFVPNTSVPVRQGLLGAACAAAVFELAKWGFAQFIRHAPSYEVVYGAFAAVPLFLLWVYISWVLVLLGAELVRALVVFQEHRRSVPRLQALLRLLAVFWERQRRGRVLRSNEVRQVLQDSGVAHWDEFRNLLQDRGLIRRTEEGGFVLTRDLRQLTLGQLIAMLPWPADQQLRVNADGKEEWEAALKQRCNQARTGLHEPLDFNLETLFENRLDEPEKDGELYKEEKCSGLPDK